MDLPSPADKKERTVLVLQGGGALGAYQAGAYEALAEAGHMPDWLAGISIGAVNAAIIAGNTPGDRVTRLRSFWERVSSQLQAGPLLDGTDPREFFNYVSAAYVSTLGVPGFFEPRFPPAPLMPRGSQAALSVYDSAPLKETLMELVDFDLLETGDVRLSVGAVNIRTGNFAYFDSHDMKLGPEHIMASGALPPGLPPVIIEGEAYWDGGLVSNTPLQYVLDYTGEPSDKCIFQVDLFSARGSMPETLLDVAQREKEIRYSSRTRLATDSYMERQTMRRAIRKVLERMPPELQGDEESKLLSQWCECDTAVTIVHLIHRRAAYDTHAQDYEFSRLSVEEHWQAGRDDVRRTLRNPKWRHRERPKSGVQVLDLAGD
ncbi:MAG TPA: patatin-like phospholipase family protein [Hyphomicrobiaceae bacterium]|nr:patatin-like phospholipase family protein [Hyphomicrobiaceae bacterium]